MSQEKSYSYSIKSTALDGSTNSSYDSNDRSVNNVSNQTHVKDLTQTSFTDLTNTVENSDKVRKKNLSRWNDCLNKKLQTQSLTNQQNPSTDQTTIVHPALDKLLVREFLPQTAHDPILSILRELFVRSFDQFYKEIEAQLKLKTNTTLMEWLQQTFDEMQDHILNKRQRCFMLCSNDETTENDSKQGIVGFLTLEEEEKGSIYIAQCAIEAENKRRGYGTRLLQHLQTIYPLGTHYWGLCRRANRPAINFYLKHGAKFMDNEEVAIKYRYDPALYTGFQMIDDTRNHTQSSVSDTSVVLSTSSIITLSSETVRKRLSQVTYQDKSTMTDPMLEITKNPLCRRNNCCMIL